MNDWKQAERLAEQLRTEYPPGTRIELNYMNDSYAVPPGTRGTVHHVDDGAHIHMRWDNHRTLPLVPGTDSFRKITEQELAEEKSEQVPEESANDIKMGGI